MFGITAAPGRRVVAWTVILAFVASTVSCSGWRPEPTTSVQERQATSLVGKSVRLHTTQGWVEVEVQKLAYPFAEGHLVVWKKTGNTPAGGVQAVKRFGSQVRVDLRLVDRVEVHHVKPVETFILIGAGVGVLLIASLSFRKAGTEAK